MEHITELLKDRQTTETIARAWPIIEPILSEQQRVIVSKNDDDCNHHKLSGFTQAYVALRKFAKEGQKSINASKQSE